VTRSLAVRAQPVVTAEYPTTAMTTDNLLNHGKGFVDAFTAAAVKLAHPSN
jgi:hypothetical protein